MVDRRPSNATPRPRDRRGRPRRDRSRRGPVDRLVGTFGISKDQISKFRASSGHSRGNRGNRDNRGIRGNRGTRRNAWERATKEGGRETALVQLVEKPQKESCSHSGAHFTRSPEARRSHGTPPAQRSRQLLSFA